MAWQDRHYYRDQSGGTGSGLWWFLYGSVPLFTAFGIRVRAHASMVLLIGLTMLFSATEGGMGVWNAMTFSTILFGIILLHEFGHCFAARSVGGEANDIMMWPLGGLAFADAPKRAWPQFWTAAGGPLVNVALCVISSIGLRLLVRGQSVPWNPLQHRFLSAVFEHACVLPLVHLRAELGPAAVQPVAGLSDGRRPTVAGIALVQARRITARR